MSVIDKEEKVDSNIELTIFKKESENSKVDRWWECNIREQFPIKSIHKTNELTVIEVD